MRRTLLTVLVTAVIVLAVVLFGRPPGNAPSDPASIRDDETAGAPVPLREETSLRGRPDEPGTAAPPGGDETTPDDERGTHAIVTGRVSGAAAEDLRGLRVVVRALRDHGWVDDGVLPIETTPDADGRYRVELDALFDARPHLGQFDVHVNHPAYLPVRVLRDVESDAATDGQGRTTYRADVALRRAIRVRGVVRDATGPVPAASVALLRRTADGLQHDEYGQPDLLDEAKTDATGRFALRAGGPGDWVVAVVAKDAAPISVSVRLEADGDPDEVEVRLEPGLALTGRVLVNGEPASGVNVTAAQDWDEAQFRLGGRDVVWRNGALELIGLDTFTDDQGAFRLAGLEETAYKLHTVWSRNVSLWRTVVAARTVTPPREVDLELHGAEVLVRVLRDGTTVEGTVLKVGTPDVDLWIHPDLDEHGEARLLLPADTTLRLEVEGGGARVEQELRTPQPGQELVHVVELGPPEPRATLVVALRDEAGAPVPLSTFTILGAMEAPLPDFRGDTYEREDGVYRLEDLEPGPLRLLVLPGRRSGEFRGYWLPLLVEAELDGDREMRVERVARRGGRIRLVVHDEDGAPMRATCRVLDRAGDPVEVLFVWGDESTTSISSAGPGATGPTTVVPPLPVGDYVLELGLPGHVDQRVPVTVKAGETTDVDATLRPR